MKRLLLALGGLALLAALVIGGFYVYALTGSDDPNLATEAPQIPTATNPGGAALAATSQPGATPAASPAPLPAGVHRFAIDTSQSTVKFIVKETLRGVPDVTTVGEGRSLSGDIYLTRSGLAATPKSTFSVDLTKINTDNSMRDNYIRQNTLRTREFPHATFTIDSVSGFPANYVENSEVQLTLTGSLTVRGQTRPVTWEVKARQAGNVLTATADAKFKMTDFGITPPDVGLARAYDDVQVQVVLVSNRVAV